MFFFEVNIDSKVYSTLAWEMGDGKIPQEDVGEGGHKNWDYLMIMWRA